MQSKVERNVEQEQRTTERLYTIDRLSSLYLVLFAFASFKKHERCLEISSVLSNWEQRRRIQPTENTNSGGDNESISKLILG